MAKRKPKGISKDIKKISVYNILKEVRSLESSVKVDQRKYKSFTKSEYISLMKHLERIDEIVRKRKLKVGLYFPKYMYKED